MNHEDEPVKVLSRQSQYEIKYLVVNSDKPHGWEWAENYLDEFFVLVSVKNRAVEPKFMANISQTAIWAYKSIRLRPSYWHDKNLLANRIARTLNIKYWHILKKDRNVGDRQISTIYAIIGQSRVWIGSFGANRAFFYNQGILTKEVGPKSGTKNVDYLGTKRYGPKIFRLNRNFLKDNLLILVSNRFLESSSGQNLHLWIKNSSSSYADQFMSFRKLLNQSDPASIPVAGCTVAKINNELIDPSLGVLL